MAFTQGAGGGETGAKAAVKMFSQLTHLRSLAEKEKENEKFDATAAIHTVITLLNIIHKETRQQKFRDALNHVMRDH